MRANRKFHGILLDVLGNLPGLDIASLEESGVAGHFILRVASTGTDEFSYELAILWARDGWPSEVRAAIAGIPDPWPPHLIVLARSLSPGALDLLRKRGANWVDEAGNVRLRIPPGLIVLKVAGAEDCKRKSGFSWSSSGIAVAEFVLSRRVSRIDLKDIADKTGWSIPQMSNVLRAFDEKEWTIRHGPPRGRGVWRDLTNPGALLDAWSVHLVENRPKRHFGHRLLRDPIRFLSDELAPLLNKLGDWAVTGWAGLEITAPFINIVPSLQIYLPTLQFHRDMATVFEEGRIRKVEEGGNIEIWEMDIPLLVATQRASGLPVVNSPRLYSDLLAIGGRAKDGAEHLREIEIGY